MSLIINNLTDDSIDHESDIKKLLVDQYCDSTNLLNLLSAISNIKQEIEHVALDLLDKRNLSNSEGTQLDGLGELVGLSREGKTDEEYRTEIGVQIQINLSGGQAEILIGLVASLTNSSVVHLTDSYPARISISFNGVAPSNLLSVISRLKAAGVGLELIQTTDNAFVFEGDPDGLGFSDEEFLDGGEFSEVI